MSAQATTCTACGGSDLRAVLTIAQAPVLCNLLCHSKEEALAAPVAPINLAYCNRCGHLFNSTFDDALINYGPDYENSLHFSARFRAYSTSLVESLHKRHGLADKAVVEVGCGNGDFLIELCEHSGARGFGFDPSFSGPRPEVDNVQLSTDSFFESDKVPTTSLLCNRHVLEHVEDPAGFVQAIANKLGPDSQAALYMEVPNALYTLRDLGIWDIIYEHPSYFCFESLRRVIASAGFGELQVEESFGGQFLSCHGTLGADDSSPPTSLGRVNDLAIKFAADYESKVAHWKSILQDAVQSGAKVAVWGAGSKGSSFLNIVDAAGQVEFVVDVNPGKHGKFVAGTGHQIVSPDTLREQPVSTVILMNPIYESEVRESLDAVCPGATILVA
jgi:SAM-dependent methyltransferase